MTLDKRGALLDIEEEHAEKLGVIARRRLAQVYRSRHE